MKYKVLKDVMIDGRKHLAGTEVEIGHDKNARLIMLGYLEEVETTNNRAVGLEGSTEKPKNRRRAKRSAE